MTSVVDWDAAAVLAGRLARPGPVADGPTLVGLVRDLREAAGTAAEHVARISGLRPADGREPAQVSAVRVVDRPRWAQANTQMFAVLSGGLPTPARVSRGARKTTAVEVGTVLGLLAGKVIGQFDPYTAAVRGEGRLLLVAPNVLSVERTLDIVPGDFRLWVALHEQTHALQFAAAPWLADHLRSRIDALTTSFDAGVAAELVRRLFAAVRDLKDIGLLALLDDDQRAVFDEVSAVMALIEGHADVMMDEVGPAVVPTVESIRAQFDQRRDDGADVRGPARLIRLLLGLDLKLAQYREGSAFVQAVRAQVGNDGFNAVWASPQTLPTAAEIADPARWIARVHPDRAPEVEEHG
ncbi:MAG: zinc-dependent metalloprotease [Micrococcales bacterium]|nr:zinc-dependent metalloprotease [Micrococcales bacterium]